MELNEYQITEIENFLEEEFSKNSLNVDDFAYERASEQVDHLVNHLIIQGTTPFDLDEFKNTFCAFMGYNQHIEHYLMKKGYSKDAINKTLSLCQSYVFLQLTKVSEYFQKFEFYEGCANIDYVKKVFSNFGESEEFKKLDAYWVERAEKRRLNK